MDVCLVVFGGTNCVFFPVGYKIFSNIIIRYFYFEISFDGEMLSA